MANPVWFVIPQAYVITSAQQFSLPATGDLRIKYEDVRAWSVVTQQRGAVVVLDIAPRGVEREDYITFVATDGPWRTQLEDWTTEETGGGGTGGSGDLRIAAGGYYAQFPTPAQVTFPAPDQWIEVTNAVLPLLPYGSAGSGNVTYDTVNNRLVLDWTSPVPLVASWMQGFAVLTTAATSNNQEYAIAWGVDGVVEPDVQVRFIRENPNDSETVTLHGHRQVPNGTSLSLFMKNLTSTSPIAVSNVNFRFFGGNNR